MAFLRKRLVHTATQKTGCPSARRETERARGDLILYAAHSPLDADGGENHLVNNLKAQPGNFFCLASLLADER